MCRTYWVISLLLLLGFLLPVVAQSGPPPTPEARNRERLKGNFSTPTGKLYSHNDSLLAATADIAILSQFVDKESLCYYRYISLHNIPPSKRETYYNCVSFLLNSFNKYRTTIRPAYGGPDNILIRVNLIDYGIDPEAWDKLGANDVYYHQTIVKNEAVVKSVKKSVQWVSTKETYLATDGKYYYKQVQQEISEPVTEIVTKKVQASAGWLDTSASLVLLSATHTQFPILRADWWIANVSVEPNYSAFLGIKSLADFENLVLYDKRAKITEVKGTVVKSGSECPRVAINNRILARRNTIYGYFWETFDYKSSVKANNVIENFRNNRRDAAEFIATLPCGLQAYLIVNGQNQPLSVGAIDIVIDTTAVDVQVRNGRSCIVCHSKGINTFSSNFQKQVGGRPDQADLGIYDIDPIKSLKIRKEIFEVFGAPNFKEIFSEDQRIYARAVRAANGLEPEVNAKNFATIWNDYVEELVTLDDLVWETGLSKPEIEAILALRINNRSNGVLLQALLKPTLSLRRDQYEENVFELLLLTTVKIKK